MNIKSILIFILGLFLINFISATSVGIFDSDFTEGKVIYSTPSVTFNNATAYVNDSVYWDGHAWGDVSFYIPYSGATSNVDLGIYNFSTPKINFSDIGLGSTTIDGRGYIIASDGETGFFNGDETRWIGFDVSGDAYDNNAITCWNGSDGICQFIDNIYLSHGANLSAYSINATDWSNVSDAISLWQRTGTTLSPKTSGDDIETTGTSTSGYSVINQASDGGWSGYDSGLKIFGYDDHSGDIINLYIGSDGIAQLINKGGNLKITSEGTIYFQPGNVYTAYLSSSAFGFYDDKIMNFGQSGSNHGYIKKTSAADTMNIGVLGTTTLKFDDYFSFVGATSSNNILLYKAGDDASPELKFQGDISVTAEVYIDGITGYLTFDSSEGIIDFDNENILTTNNIYNRADNSKHYFGAGDDCSMGYNITDWLFNPREVGSGDGWLLNDWHVTGNLSVKGNVTAENVFLPAEIFTHTLSSQDVKVNGEWVNITFNETDTDIKKRITHNPLDATNDTFIIVDSGTYDFQYAIKVQDPTNEGSNIGVRLIVNNVEIKGSYFEIDVDKKDIDRYSNGFSTAILSAGDEIKLQYTSNSTTALLKTDGTFGDHDDTVKLRIRRSS